jgi:hypothetical protein
MFCQYCGEEISDNAVFCGKCGRPLGPDVFTINSNPMQSAARQPGQKRGLSISSMILGLIGLAAWILPVVGFPVVIIGLILGIIGRDKGAKGIATAGIVLCTITLILTTANSAIGAYMGFHGLLPFQKSNVVTSGEDKTNSPDTFSLRDKDGNILMEGGIKSASAITVKEATGSASYGVEMIFDDSGSEQFSKITSEHIGESIGIYLNEDMLSNPVVESAITGGTCQISGLETYEDAVKLADILNTVSE